MQKELAAKMQIQPATLTVMINRMAKAGLIERKHDAEDQRVSRVYLTDKGRYATSKVKEALFVVEDRCFKSFSPEEKILFRRLLMQIHNDLEAGRSDA